MTTLLQRSPEEIAQLRDADYNAELVDIVPVHAELRILRVRPDWGHTSFAPGQYSVLGLGNWERRVPDCQEEVLQDLQRPKLLKRAYSFSCPMLAADGRLQPPEEGEFLEFYIVLIRRGETRPPGLTPRLFALVPGDRLFAGPKVTGHYTLEAVRATDDVVFVATGTGEAPHNAMLAHLLARGHQGRLVAVTCTRFKRDLGYLETHRALERQFGDQKYRYLTLTTREPENLDASHAGYVGKRYLQEYFESGHFERDSGVKLDPTRAHFFLCGNPAMIGAPLRGSGGTAFPSPKGMVEILVGRGFRPDEPGRLGNIHFEKYW
jgi:ferredoxin--NADP+ reductase